MNSRNLFLADIAKRFAHSVSHQPQIEATSNLFFELIMALSKSQRRRNQGAPDLVYKIRHARGEMQLVLIVENLEVIDQHEDLAELRRIAGENFISARFQFQSEESGDALNYGVIAIALLLRGPQSDDETEEEADARVRAARSQLARAHVQPDLRRAATFAINWEGSAVRAPSDRTLILEMIDDVYNMHQLMPAAITTSLEELVAENHIAVNQTVGGNKKRKNRRADDEAGLVSSTENSAIDAGRCIGYSVHFVGVPSFDDNFLTFMKHKYGSRWLNAVVIFPHERVGRSMPPALVLTLACSNAVAKEAQQFSIVGAKRLCMKVYADPAAVPNGDEDIQ